MVRPEPEAEGILRASLACGHSSSIGTFFFQLYSGASTEGRAR